MLFANAVVGGPSHFFCKATCLGGFAWTKRHGDTLGSDIAKATSCGDPRDLRFDFAGKATSAALERAVGCYGNSHRLPWLCWICPPYHTQSSLKIDSGQGQDVESLSGEAFSRRQLGGGGSIFAIREWAVDELVGESQKWVDVTVWRACGTDQV